MRKPDLLTAIVVAKYFLDTCPEMRSSVEHDRLYLGKEKYEMHKQVPMHTCIKPFIRVIKNFLRTHTGSEEIEIKIYQVDTRGIFKGASRIAGIMAKVSEMSYFILLNSEETYCTQRLSLCKELCEIYASCLYNEPAKLDAHNQILEAARELLEKFYLKGQQPNLTDTFNSSEAFAHALALELMIPYTERDLIKKELSKKTPRDKIAKMLSITKETLDEYLNTYFNLTTPIYNLL